MSPVAHPNATVDVLKAFDLYGDPLIIWRNWADDVSGHGIDSGHHMAELAPDNLAAELGRFLT